MNVKRIIIISSAAAFIILAAALAVSVKIGSLNRQIAQSKSALLRMADESARVKEEKEKLAADNEKLQADTVSYVNLNTKLQSEKDDLQKAVDDARKLIENRESDLKRIKERLNEVEKFLAGKRSKEHGSLIREKKAITKKVMSLNAALKKEKALYHYNLGVAYATAKLYDDAIAEYKSSLESDPYNADAHYNLAVLYGAAQSGREDSALHYRKYLELNPDADDRQDVEAILNKLR